MDDLSRKLDLLTDTELLWIAEWIAVLQELGCPSTTIEQFASNMINKVVERKCGDTTEGS